jgi:hypothetical protein
MTTPTRYLEFDSAYRDRSQYPDPAYFVCEISQTGNKTKNFAKDPVTDASPIKRWNTSFNEGIGATSVAVSGIDISNTTSDVYTFIITGSQGAFRTIDNYYNNVVLQLTNTDATPITILTRINSYELISSTGAGDVSEVSVDTPLPANFIGGAITAAGNMYNPTNDTSTALVPQVFVPAGSSIDNYYYNYYIQNLTTNESFLITYYDGNTSLATLSGNTTASWLSANSNICIRKSLPSSTGTLVSSVNSSSLKPAVLQLSLTTASDTSGTYDGSFIRMTTPVPVAPFSTEVSPYAQEAKIQSYIAGSGLIVSIVGTTFTLNATTSSSVDGYYVGCLITDTTTNDTKQIITYNGTTHSGTTSAAWTAVAGNTWIIRSAFIKNSFTTLPTTQTYEIEQYTRDNWVPFSYNGSLVSSQESVCYEVELLNLILPNTTLASGRGGRVIFYPYVYVKLQPISSSADNKGLIYSNNPNAYEMIFRAVVNDTTQPVYSPFVKIDSGGMTHTMKFKPNDSFLFAVYLPGGELFKTVSTDFYSPSAPNPLVQISACFSFKRA